MWDKILGHNRVVEQFRRAAVRERLPGSYLFIGPGGVGKRTFALALAKALLCQNHKTQELKFCGKCSACLQVDSGNHPDVISIAKPAEKSSIPLDMLIGEKENRGKSGLCYEISRKPYSGGYKIAIIDDADDLNQEGANALLKTLEEPPPSAVLILIGTSAAKQLPTIRSRCKLIRFFPLRPLDLSQLLQNQGLVDSAERALRIAKSADGGLERCKALCDESLDEIRDPLFRELALAIPNPVGFAIKLNEFVDAAGKEAPLRRKRLRLVFDMVLDFYQNAVRSFSGMEMSQLPNRDLIPYLQKTTGAYHSDTSRLIRASERTLVALEQIDRNVQLPYIIDAWLLEMSHAR